MDNQKYHAEGVQTLLDAAKWVVKSWSGNKLARAVNGLDHAIDGMVVDRGAPGFTAETLGMPLALDNNTLEQLAENLGDDENGDASYWLQTAHLELSQRDPIEAERDARILLFMAHRALKESEAFVEGGA